MFFVITRSNIYCAKPPYNIQYRKTVAELQKTEAVTDQVGHDSWLLCEKGSQEKRGEEEELQ